MKLVVLINLMVVTILLPQVSLEENHGMNVEVKDGREIECGGSNMCPTRFVCNSQNNCQCGNGQSNMIVAM